MSEHLLECPWFPNTHEGLFVTIDNLVEEVKVRLAGPALTTAERMAVEALPNEFGGILVGWWEGGLTAIVVDLLPVLDPHAGRAHYKRRHPPAQETLDAFLATFDDPRCGYIGEWHSHPAAQPPSSIDREALAGIVRQVRRPVALVVLSLTTEREVVVHGLVGHPRGLRRIQLTPALIERM